jgi:thioredoxin-like negative regulator of GroEL
MLKVETPAQLKSQVLSANKALLFFTTPDCPDSAFVKERLDMVKGRNGSLTIASADMTRVPALARALNVTEAPTVVLFRWGKRISHLTGKVSAREIQNLVDSVFW